MSSNNFPSWFSRDHIKSVKKKKHYHKLYKIYKSDKNLFSIERAKCNSLCDKDHNSHIEKVEEGVRNDTSYFFKYINSLTTSRDFPSTMYLENETAGDGLAIVNLFAKKFGSVYVNSALPNFTPTFSCDTHLESIFISDEDVYEAITNIKANSTPGPDDIHPMMVKNCIAFFTPFLSKLFNISLNQGFFPSQWKLNYITPLFKNGKRNDISNYRPICKPSIFAKIFDKIVCDKLNIYLTNFIDLRQHGFIRGRSTLTNLGEFNEYLVENMNKRLSIDVIYTDFSRAFDMVNTNLLLDKLAAYGLHDKILKWIRSFLADRVQRVEIKNFISRQINVVSGVGQGSHLALPFFLIFINDIASHVKFCEFQLFTDDLKIYKCIEDNDSSFCLQSDLDNIHTWSTSNGLPFNLSKCVVMTFSKNRTHDASRDYFVKSTKLNRVENVKDLGVIFDSKLSFNCHIDYIVSNTTVKLNFIKRFSRYFSDPETFRTLYFSFISSKLNYASVIWNPHLAYQITKIESVRHKFLRYVSWKIRCPMKYDNHNYGPIAMKTRIATLESYRTMNDVLFMYKLVNKIVISNSLYNRIVFYSPIKPVRGAPDIFYIKPFSLNLSYQSIITRLSLTCNQHKSILNFDSDSISSLRLCCENLLDYN